MDENTSGAPGPRPNFFALPSPTTTRSVVFVLAMIVAGAFVGAWVHLQVRGDDWVDVARRCEYEAAAESRTLPPLEAAVVQVRRADECRREADRVRSWYLLAGAVLPLIGSIAVMAAAPQVLERRRRLRSPDPGAPGMARAHELADECDLGGRVRFMLGSSRQRDTFSYGNPWNLRVAVAPALAAAWRRLPNTFDTVVRHELGHVRNRDVAVSWVARSVWYVLLPLLVVPVVVALAGDRSLIPDYLWRVLVLAAAVQLIARQLLRSREYGADLRAAQASSDVGAVAAVVATIPERPQAGALRRSLSMHPSPAARVEVVVHPERADAVGLADGLVAAFLVGLVEPTLVETLWVSLGGSTSSDGIVLTASLALGAVLAASVGLNLWRQAAAFRVVGRSTAWFEIAAGVFLGVPIGRICSVGLTGSGELGGVSHLWTLAITALAAFIGVAIVASLGECFVDAAERLGSARGMAVACMVVSTTVFAAALFVGLTAETLVDAGAWAAFRDWVLWSSGSWWMLVAITVIAGAVAMTARPSMRLPAWLVEASDRDAPLASPGSRGSGIGVGATAGLAAVILMYAYRWTAGVAVDDAAAIRRIEGYRWLGAAAGALAAIALVLRSPRRGAGLAMLSGPLAGSLTAAGFVALNAILGGSTPDALRLVPEFVSMTFLAAALVAGLTSTAIVARSQLASAALERGRHEELGHREDILRRAPWDPPDPGARRG